jgi:hypothetical protein
VRRAHLFRNLSKHLQARDFTYREQAVIQVADIFQVIKQGLIISILFQDKTGLLVFIEKPLIAQSVRFAGFNPLNKLAGDCLELSNPTWIYRYLDNFLDGQSTTPSLPRICTFRLPFIN